MTVERFLFAPVDRRTARIFRVGLAAMLVLVFWPAGHVPIGRIARAPDLAAIWETVFLSAGWWGAALLAVAAFAAGIGGRISGWTTAALLLPLVPVRSAQSRQVLWLALLAFSLLRSGAAPVDARTGREAPAGPIWPLRLVQLQLSVLYAVNAWAKATPDYLRGDVLIGLSRSMPNFLVDLSDGYLVLGTLALPGAAALGTLAVPVWLCAVGTVAVETALAVGLWIPKLRLATAALGVGFHLSLRGVLTIGWLDWVSVFLYLAFLLPFETQWTERSANGQAGSVRMVDDSPAPGATR